MILLVETNSTEERIYKKYKPFLQELEEQLQLTLQFFHKSPCLDCIAKWSHCRVLNTLLNGEGMATEQGSQAAKEENILS